MSTTYIRTLSPRYRDVPRLSIGVTSLYNIHHLPGSSNLLHRQHPTILVISASYPIVLARIAACHLDISTWMRECHIQVNLSKAELCHSGQFLHYNINIKIATSSLTPGKVVRMFFWIAIRLWPCCICLQVMLLCSIQDKKNHTLSDSERHPTLGTRTCLSISLTSVMPLRQDLLQTLWYLSRWSGIQRHVWFFNQPIRACHSLAHRLPMEPTVASIKFKSLML